MNHMVGTGHPTSAHPFFLPPPPSLNARLFCAAPNRQATRKILLTIILKLAALSSIFAANSLEYCNFLAILKQIGLKIHKYE